LTEVFGAYCRKVSWVVGLIGLRQANAIEISGEWLTVAIDFKGVHFPKAIILHTVFFHVRYAVSCRDLEAITAKRGFSVDNATLDRRVVKFSPLIAANAQGRKRLTAVL